jgi:acetyl esterase/lipase
MPLSGPWAPRIHFGAARVGILEFACDDDWQAHFVGAMLCRIFRWNWLGALMHLVFALAGALLLSLICDKADAQVAREAFYSIPSETASAADFLTGKKGTPIALAGQLRFAKAGPTRQPVVILLHSASGPIAEGAPYEEWPRILNEVGIATFAVDSYAGRGLVNYPADPGKISFLTRIIDAYRALEVVAKEPRIDPSRIAVMGFSQGASAALYSSMARFQKMYGNPDLQFVGHISAYADCKNLGLFWGRSWGNSIWPERAAWVSGRTAGMIGRKPLREPAGI